MSSLPSPKALFFCACNQPIFGKEKVRCPVDPVPSLLLFHLSLEAHAHTNSFKWSRLVSLIYGFIRFYRVLPSVTVKIYYM